MQVSDGDYDGGAGAGAQAEESAGDAHGLARSAGIAGRALVVLHGQHAAGAAEPPHHDRAPRLVHQRGVSARLRVRAEGVGGRGARSRRPGRLLREVRPVKALNP